MAQRTQKQEIMTDNHVDRFLNAINNQITFLLYCKDIIYFC